MAKNSVNNPKDTLCGGALRGFARLAYSVLPEPNGSTRLIKAARAGDARRVRLLANEKTAKQVDHWGRSALAWAAAEGHADCVRALLPLSDERSGLGADGLSPLMAAAFAGQREIVKLLLSASDPRLVGHRGWTALMCAARSGSAEVIELLLPGSDPMAIGDDGRDALMWAAQAQSLPAVQALLPVSDPSRLDKNGQSALMISARVIGNPTTIDIARWLAPESEAWRRDKFDQTAATIADRAGAFDLSKELEALAIRQRERLEIASAAETSSSSRASVRI